VCDFLAGCVLKCAAVTAGAGSLAGFGAPHDRGVTEKMTGNLIDVKFDVRIFDSTLAQYQF